MKFISKKASNTDNRYPNNLNVIYGTCKRYLSQDRTGTTNSPDCNFAK